MRTLNNRHRKTVSRRLLSTSLMATTSLLGVMAAFPAAYGQTASVETVTVTGTSIRGEKPLGSNLITVDRAAIDAIGAQNTLDILDTVPQVSGFGGAGQNSSPPVIHSLGAQSSAATLLLVDGHIIPGGGGNDLTFVPTLAVESVEVLPDGASAIYGSDAIAGVINIHTRKNYNGWETSIQDSFAPDYNSFGFGQIFGHSWDGGGVTATYSYSSRSHLMNINRDFITARQDLRRGAADPARFTGLPAASIYGTTLQTVTPTGQAVPYPSDGGNFQNFSCPVATIASSTSATVGAFAYPYVGTTILPRQTNPTGGPGDGICDTNALSSSLPSLTRNSGLISLRQTINSRLSVNMDVIYSAGQSNSLSPLGGVASVGTAGQSFPTNVEVFNPKGTGNASFGAANSAAALGSTNPFYVGVPGQAANANNEFITVDLSQILAKEAGTIHNTNKTANTTAYATLGFDYELGGDWFVSVAGMTGGTTNVQSVTGVSTPQFLLALNGTTSTTGTAPTNAGNSSLVDQYGLGTLNAATRVLTTLNALDVWNPPATNRTSEQVLRSILDGADRATANNNVEDLTLHADGPIGDFWGAGQIKMAVGGEYTHISGVSTQYQQNTQTPSSEGVRQAILPNARSVYAAYVEIVVPFVSPDMNVPLMRGLTLDAAGRWDHYNDFGDTENPKISLQWDIVDGISASFTGGTSFVAPNLGNLGAPKTALNGISGIMANNSGAPNNLVVLFNDTRPFNDGKGIAGTWVANPFSCAAAGSQPVTDGTGSTNATLAGGVWTNAAGCKIINQNGLNSQGITFATGSPFLKPQLGQSYSANLVFDDFGKFFDVLEGLSTQITYYQTKFSNAITNIGIITSQTNAGLPQLTHFAPANCVGNVCSPGWAPTDPVIQTLVLQAPLNAPLPSTIYSWVDNRVQNAYTLWQNGLDFQIRYRLVTDNYGSFNFALNGNQILRGSQRNGLGTAIFDIKDGNNGGRFADNELTARASLSWNQDPYRVGLSLNFQHPYHIGVTTFPFSLPGPGRPANRQNVGAFTTADLNFGYNLPQNWISGASVNMTISNVLDSNPPYVDNTSGSSGISPIGRLVEVGLLLKM